MPIMGMSASEIASRIVKVEDLGDDQFAVTSCYVRNHVRVIRKVPAYVGFGTHEKDVRPCYPILLSRKNLPCDCKKSQRLNDPESSVRPESITG